MTEAELTAFPRRSSDAVTQSATRLAAAFLRRCTKMHSLMSCENLGSRSKFKNRFFVQYDGVIVGEYFADLLIEDVLLVELKAINGFNDIHKAQCINYLNSTRLPLCLLINFGRPRVEIKRIFQSQFLENIA